MCFIRKLWFHPWAGGARLWVSGSSWHLMLQAERWWHDGCSILLSTRLVRVLHTFLEKCYSRAWLWLRYVFSKTAIDRSNRGSLLSLDVVCWCWWFRGYLRRIFLCFSPQFLVFIWHCCQKMFPVFHIQIHSTPFYPPALSVPPRLVFWICESNDFLLYGSKREIWCIFRGSEEEIVLFERCFTSRSEWMTRDATVSYFKKL